MELQFELGQADSLDVIDANSLLNIAERELAEAEFYLDLSRIGLARAQGIFLKTIQADLAVRNSGAAPAETVAEPPGQFN